MPPVNKRNKYNLQPYRKDGDTSGFRNLLWYKKNILPLIKENMVNRDKMLDLGCGNGRFNTLTHNLFKNIICVDPIEDLENKFTYKNVKFLKNHLHELHKLDFDVILMIGSMLSIWRKYGEKTLQYLSNLLNEEGLIFVVISNQNYIFNFEDETYLKILKIYKLKDKKTNLIIFKKCQF